MSDDTISRDAAIDAIFKTCRRTCTLSHELEKAFERLPSAQPHDIARDIATIIENEKDMRVMLKNAQPDVPDTNGGDIIYRRAAIDALIERDPNCGIDSAEVIKDLPSAHPELNEWCHDCKEYDQEHHCCPRWNRVIKTTLEKAQPEKPTEEILNDAHNEGYDVGYWAGRRDYEQKWIPCSERLPEDYEDVLVWFEYFRYGDYNRLYQAHGIGDYSSEYDSWMINHESGWSKLRVLAWMPLPEPYKGEQE